MFLVAGVNPVDYKIRKGDALKFVVPKPKIPGGDLSGVVEDAPEKSKV
jgi:NADPH:quinone reductase-like Zn-dependent oxidoreductase